LTDTAESWTNWKEYLIISGGPGNKIRGFHYLLSSENENLYEWLTTYLLFLDVHIEMATLKGPDGDEYSVLVAGKCKY